MAFVPSLGVNRVVATTFALYDNASAGLRTLGAHSARAGVALDTVRQVAGRTLRGAVSSVSMLENAIGRTILSVTRLINPLSLLLGGGLLVGGVLALSSMHAQAETTRLQIAGMLNALGQVPDVATGMQWADSIMQQINRDAAALPGNAEDYIQIFNATLPAAVATGAASVEEFMRTTDRLSALALGAGIDAATVGRETLEVLQGHATTVNHVFRNLAPVLHTSAQQLNAMTAPQRWQRLTMVVTAFSQQLDASNETFDAIYGTTQQLRTQLIRSMTVPVFNQIKQSLAGINVWLTTHYDQIVNIGQAVSRYLVGGFNRALNRAVALGQELQRLGDRLLHSTWFNRLFAAGQAAVHGVTNAAGGQVGRLLGGIAGASVLRAVFGPAGMIIGPVIMRVANNMDSLQRVIDNLLPIFDAVAAAVGPTAQMLDLVNATIGDAVWNVLPGLSSVVGNVVVALLGFWVQLVGIYTRIATELRPTIMELSTALGEFLGTVGNVLGPALVILGHIIGWIANQFLNVMLPPIRQFGHMMAQLLHWMSTTLGRVIPGLRQLAGTDVRGPGATGTPPAVAAAEDFLTRMHGIMDRAQAAQAAAEHRLHGGAQTPAQRGGHGTYNDFRNSRFDITQRFAEGYDPDRIALAFSHDLERTADQRLQSGLEPVFGVGR